MVEKLNMGNKLMLFEFSSYSAIEKVLKSSKSSFFLKLNEICYQKIVKEPTSITLKQVNTFVSRIHLPFLSRLILEINSTSDLESFEKMDLNWENLISLSIKVKIRLTESNHNNLGRILLSSKMIKYLKLLIPSNFLSINDILMYSEFFSSLQNLESLICDFSSNRKINSNIITDLISILPNSLTILVLNLSSNNFSHQIVVKISDILIKFKNLKTLKIDMSTTLEHDSDSSIYLFSSISKRENLEKLSLSLANNCFTNNTIQSICGELAKMTSLKLLNLDFSFNAKLTREAVQSIIKTTLNLKLLKEASLYLLDIYRLTENDLGLLKKEIDELQFNNQMKSEDFHLFLF